MRYQESREQSAELLRLVLPLMSRHVAGFNPLTYAVWYEYVRGSNSALSTALDAAIAKGKPLDDEDISQLFDTHVALRDIESSMRMRNRMEKMLEEVNQATSQTSTEVAHYSDGLDRYQERLRTEQAPAAVAEVVGSLLSDTLRVQVRTTDLQQQLHQSSAEIEQLRQDLQAAQGLAHTDPLTGLLNRRGLEKHVRDRFSGALAGCALLLFDIDEFRQINDAHGHLLGDRVINAVGHSIRRLIEPQGVAARLGGEEFAALLADRPAEEVAALADSIRGAVERGRIKRQDQDASVGGVTVSVGAAFGVGSESFEALLERASRALLRSKQDGRNRVTVAARTAAGGPA
jgi:diguanylate cyclase